MDVQLKTQSLAPGAYELLITQQDGNSRSVKFKVLPNPPKIENLPIIVNRGAATQHFVLRGERLGQITKLEAPGAIFQLSPAAPDQTERDITADLRSAPEPGARISVHVFVQDRSEPLVLANALEITGPLPVIAGAKLSLPAGLAIAIRPAEFPAGYTLNALLDVKNFDRTSVLRLRCADGVGGEASLHIGGKTAQWSLQQLSADQLFLAFDSTGMPAGCSLQALVDRGREGSSRPFELAHILRLPMIDSVTVSAEEPQDGARQYRITGENLEIVQRLGWTENEPVDVFALPIPQPGPGLKQSLDVQLPDPRTPDATLWLWLRGDRQGRASTIKAPALAPAPDGSPASAGDT